MDGIHICYAIHLPIYHVYLIGIGKRVNLWGGLYSRVPAGVVENAG